MTDNDRMFNDTGPSALDEILGRSAAVTAEQEIVPERAEVNTDTADGSLEEPTKAEKKAEKKATRKAKRAAKNGVSLFLVVLIVLAINVFWMGYIEYYVRPSYESRIEEVIAEKDDAIKRIQAVYKVREEDFEKRLTACEEKQAQLEEMYNNAILIIEKYGGDLSFLEDKTEEVKKE